MNILNIFNIKYYFEKMYELIMNKIICSVLLYFFFIILLDRYIYIY